MKHALPIAAIATLLASYAGLSNSGESDATTIRPGIRDWFWMGVGASVLLAVVLLMLLFQRGSDVEQRIAFAARRGELVAHMRLTLAAASEAEKSAVLAVSGVDARNFVEQARSATAEVDRQRGELAQSLRADGTAAERGALERFATTFAEFQRIDGALLELAGENTNLEASRLTFGAAADALEEMHAPLARLVGTTANTPAAREVVQSASGVEIGALRIHALLAPHIAEANDQRMDELEARMAELDRDVRRGLDSMGALPALAGSEDLAAASASYARFDGLRTKILALSRKNTHVRATSVSLDEKRKATLDCQDALRQLQEALASEPSGPHDFGLRAETR